VLFERILTQSNAITPDLCCFVFRTCLKQNELRSRAERKVTDTVRPDGRIDGNKAQWYCEKIGFTKQIYCYLDERFVWGGI
jgi:hypothetical protein